MEQRFQQVLKVNKSSLTTSRLALFRYLQKRGPVSIGQILAENSDFDQATIYRALSLFRHLRVAEDIVTGGRRQIELTDKFSEHHHHIACLECGITKAITSATLESWLDKIAHSQGFKVATHQVELSGYCQNCQTVTTI